MFDTKLVFIMLRASEVVVFYISVAVFTLTSHTFAKSTSYCPLNSTNVTELREPIILTNSSGKLEFYIPSVNNGKLVFDNEQKFIILCPNPRNSLTLSHSNMTTGQCINGKLHIIRKAYSFQELSCNRSIRGDVQQRIGPQSSCDIENTVTGTLIDIGYNVDVIHERRRIEFLPLIETCHNMQKGITFYSNHILRGHLMKQASSSKFRPGFSTQGLWVSASIAYKQAYQKAAFTRLLGSSVLADNYITSKSFLSRGHLAPDADFLFAPWQFSTYFYLNAVPQWQQINGGNWHRVESMVRKLAEQLGTDLRILTGTYGVLALPSVDSSLVDMYMLPKETLPIPKYIWKLVHSPMRKEAIVLVSLNNPFIKSRGDVEIFCKDICEVNGWYQNNWEKLAKGAIFCCEYKEFVRVVRSVPVVVVNGVLQGSKK